MIRIAALLLASQTQAPGGGPGQIVESAAKVLTRMFAHYASAQTLSSKITMVQSAMNKKVEFDTLLAYERPFKIFFTQKKRGDASYSPHLVSNGTLFLYSAPENVDNHRITDFTESVHPKEGDITIAEMWPTMKQHLLDGDDSFALEAMIARPANLQRIRGELLSFTNKGKIMLGNKLVNDIEGKSKEAAFGEQGDFAMFVTDEGDLVREVLKMRFTVNAKFLIDHHLSPTAFSDGIEVTTEWNMETQVDQPIDPHVFMLPAAATSRGTSSSKG